MQIQLITDKFLLSPSIRDYLAKRLSLAFAPFRDRIQSISVRLADLNGPRGGRDMLCQVAVAMPGMPGLLVKDVQEDLYAAIDRAVKRASYRASQLVSRSRLRARRKPPHVQEEIE
jgi:ribosome-associated translation inhibitor RaiA